MKHNMWHLDNVEGFLPGDQHLSGKGAIPWQFETVGLSSFRMAMDDWKIET